MLTLPPISWQRFAAALLTDGSGTVRFFNEASILERVRRFGPSMERSSLLQIMQGIQQAGGASFYTDARWENDWLVVIDESHALWPMTEAYLAHTVYLFKGVSEDSFESRQAAHLDSLCADFMDEAEEAFASDVADLGAL